ncbi:MAG: tRNA preQ1(34) S-adenosylmethionine ribosyltransferase-isomerase QueA [Patescibacteria group bacterium]
MDLSLFSYSLPKELIAIKPAEPRDSANLLVYDRLNTKITHTLFNGIADFFSKGDVLVLNNTKVIPARLIGKFIHSDGMLGRKFKILLLEKKTTDTWTCLIDGKGREAGLEIDFSGLKGTVSKRIGGGIWEIKFNKKGKILEKMIFKIGQMPLPPYIKQDGYKKENKEWYQPVFAKYAGSVAAPTASLHFTKKLLEKLKNKGVKIEYITLHVGMGTFMPVKTKKIEDHKMHKELAVVLPKTAKVLNLAKKNGGKIVACGTTAARALESFASGEKVRPGKKYTNIFIYPPKKLKILNALITNFHLPESSLLMLVSAFLSPGKKDGIKILKNIYGAAIQKKYRFYSYGDAMLIL